VLSGVGPRVSLPADPCFTGGLLVRQPKLWFRATLNAWYVEHHGKQVRLGDHPEGAQQPKKTKGSCGTNTSCRASANTVRQSASQRDTTGPERPKAGGGRKSTQSDTRVDGFCSPPISGGRRGFFCFTRRSPQTAQPRQSNDSG